MRTSISKQTISSELAHALIAAAEREGAAIGLPIAVTIVDEAGVLKAFSRMDGAALIAVTASRKKALTAVGFGIPTGESWHNFIKDDPILLHGAQHLDDFILLGGGSPIVVDGAVIGAIGVSGGHYHQDERCVAAALALLAAPAA
ncbi:MAG: heme-binding protein [Nannocystis sp.]|jgi:uncharacterized protein GlcG (DUF336 family)|nr:heme-binding protein [Nannocystis sp.]